MGELLLKQASKMAIAEEMETGAAQAGGNNSITLATGASAVDDYYNGKPIEVISGTAIGQKNIITDYNGTTKVATVSKQWTTNPVSGDVYEIPLFGTEPASGNFAVIDIVDVNPLPVRERLSRNVLRNTFDKSQTLLGAESVAYDLTFEMKGAGAMHSGTAQAGAAGTITLATGASAVDDFYNGRWVKITGGTGSGQMRLIKEYVGSTKVATIAPNWTTAPDNTSIYEILGVLPESDVLWKCLTGRKKYQAINVWPAITSSSSPFTTLTMDDADDLSVFAVNDLVLIVSGNGTGGEVRRITAIDNVAPGKTITLSQGCSADPDGKYIKGGVQYQLKLGTDVGLRWLPSFYAKFLRGGEILEKFAGNKISNGKLEWTSGQIVNVVLTIEGQRRASIAAGILAGTPPDFAILPHVARFVDFFIGGISYPVSSLSAALANTLFRQASLITSGTQNLIRTGREVTGSFSLLYDEDYITIEQAWDAQTLAEMLMVSSRGDADLTPGNIFAACIPQIKYLEVPKADESGIYRFDVAFESVYVNGEDTIFMAWL